MENHNRLLQWCLKIPHSSPKLLSSVPKNVVLSAKKCLCSLFFIWWRTVMFSQLLLSTFSYYLSFWRTFWCFLILSQLFHTFLKFSVLNSRHAFLYTFSFHIWVLSKHFAHFCNRKHNITLWQPFLYFLNINILSHIFSHIYTISPNGHWDLIEMLI